MVPNLAHVVHVVLSGFDIFGQTLNSSYILQSKYYVTQCSWKYLHMTDYFLNVPSQKFPVPKITKQTKSHSLNFNVLSSVIDSSGEEV